MGFEYFAMHDYKEKAITADVTQYVPMNITIFC